MSLFVDYLRSTPLYRELCALTEYPGGNLLENTSDETAEAQTEFLRWALRLAQPASIIETGTNKGMFAYFLSQVCRGVTLHTFDVWEESAKAAAYVQNNQGNVWISFQQGDSRVTLETFGVRAGFAWIDGDHEGNGPLSDVANCARLEVPYVAMDDANEPDVQAAIDEVVRLGLYRVVANPFQQHDKRKATLLKLI
jgi:hypothetical protein